MAKYTPIEQDMPVVRESGDFGIDPESGAAVLRMTTSPAHNNNIYCEQPYGGPDGKRFPIMRAQDMFSSSRQMLVGDLETGNLTLVEPDRPEEGVAHPQFGEWLYYPMHDGSLRRVSLVSLVRQQVMPAGTLPVEQGCYIETMSSDERYIVGYERVVGEAWLRSYVLDLETGEKRVINDGPTNTNPHAQIDPTPGSTRCMHQLLQRDDRGTAHRIEVRVQDILTGGSTLLPLGGEWSAESTGHMAWVGHTGRIICAVGCDREAKTHDPRHPEGNLLIVTPGEDSFKTFHAPERFFWHTSVSRCGRYFVSDDFMDFKGDAFNGSIGPIRIVVGNLETGKHRALVRDVMSHGIAGSSRFEPNPYFTADCRYVIYNASPHGLTQVFAAEVPEGFLASLE